MYAKRIEYLKGEIFYIYDDEDVLIATYDAEAHVINWDGSKEEPYTGANLEVLVAVGKAKEEVS